MINLMMKIKILKNFYKNPENKNLIINIIETFGIKGIAMFLTLFTMPSYMRYFQNNFVLGVWFSIVSILNWIMTFDLGIGNGLRNHLVPALHEHNIEKIKKLISSAYILLGIISIIIGFTGILIIKNTNLNNIFNIDKNIISQLILSKSICIVFLGVIIQFFLKIITSIFYAMQKTAIPSLISLISSILILVFVNIYQEDSAETKLLILSYAQAITICVPPFVATVIVFSTKLKAARPSIKSFDWKDGKKVVGLGGQFFLIQICLMIINSTNEILISRLASPADTVEYQVYQRIFYAVITAFSLLIQPMWSAFSQANATKNYIWIKSVYKKFKKLVFIGSAGCFIIAIIFQYIVNIWLGAEAVTVKIDYSIYFAILVSMMLYINISTCVANGLNELKCQIIWTCIGAICKIPVAIIVVWIVNSWIGVVISNIIVLVPLTVFQYYDSNKKLKEKILLYNNNQ